MAIPKELVKGILERRCVLFAGAGLSCAAGLPNWRELLKLLIEKAQTLGRGGAGACSELRCELEAGNLGCVADEVREILGATYFPRAIQELLCPPGLKPTKTHFLLNGIPFFAAYTTNYDKLIESAYIVARKGEATRMFLHDNLAGLASAFQLGEFYVMKAHGTIDQVDNLVFGPSDYRRLLRHNNAYREHLLCLLSTKVVLFLGYSLNDPDLSFFLEELRAIYGGHQPEHYAVFESSTIRPLLKKCFSNTYGIQVVPWRCTSRPGITDIENFIYELDKEVHPPSGVAPPRIPQAPGLDDLVQDVAYWLISIGFAIEARSKIDGRIVDLRAQKTGAVNARVLVRCVGDGVTSADVDGAAGQVTPPTSEAWLITNDGATPLPDKNGVRIFRLADFLNAAIWSPYFTILKDMVARDKIPERYVPMTCSRIVVNSQGQKRYEPSENLESCVDAWLKRAGSEAHLSILGDFGSGKTWFCRYYAHRQLNLYLADPVAHRLPLLISLRSFATAETPRELINDALREQYKLEFRDNGFDVFQKLNRSGRLLLILDGFDEMARKVDDQKVVSKFFQLVSLVEEQSKVILTSRTEYFRRVEGAIGLRQVEKPRFGIVYIEPFNAQQIQQAIEKRLGPYRGPETGACVAGAPNLAEIARKPELMNLLVTALGSVPADRITNRGQAYLHATKELLRDSASKAAPISTADKLLFLCELAWDMLKSGNLRVHSNDMPGHIRACFEARKANPDELKKWGDYLLAGTLLQCDSAGYWEFAHKSLVEYFAGYKFVAGIGCLSDEFRTAYGEGGLPVTVSDIRDLDLPPVAAALASDMVSKDFEYMQKLCMIAWEESGLVGWNAQNILPFLKHPYGADLVKLLLEEVKVLKQNGTYRMRSGVAWVFGELGVKTDEVKAVLNEAIGAMSPEDRQSTGAWWEAAFALEKLEAPDLGSDAGDRAIGILIPTLPETYTAETVRENLRKCYEATNPAGVINHCDVVGVVKFREWIDPVRLFKEVFGQIDISRDTQDRRAYFAVWLCGHLKIKTRECVDTVIKATTHPHASVRNCAAEALGKIGDRSAGVESALEDRLQDGYYRTRYHAAWSLGELGLKDALPKLIEAIQAEEIPDVRAKMEAVRQLLGSE